MIPAGILLGVTASLFQSFSYLFSRRFLKEYGDDWLMLLTVSHISMGVMSLVILPFLCTGEDISTIKAGIMPSIGAAGFYFAAQGMMFAALRSVEASRISPLLGMKVITLALLAAFLGKQHLHWQNWLAVAMSGAGAYFLNEIGGRIPGKAFVFVGLTLAGYSLSDVNIKDLLGALAPAGARGPFIGVCLSYIFCGLFGVLMLFRTGLPQRRAWLLSLPPAVAWLASMFLFYWSIQAINLVFAVIVQSTRGIISIGLGAVVARMGHEHLEQTVSRSVLWKRVAAAALMVAAIALYAAYRN